MFTIQLTSGTYPRNRRPYYAVSNRDISQNFSSTRHNTPSVTVSCRIETDSTLAVSSGPVDCPIRQASLGSYCSAVLKTRLSSVVSCRIEVMIFLFFTADEVLEFLFYSFSKHLHLLRKPLRRSVEKIFLFFASVRVYNTIRLSKPPSVNHVVLKYFLLGSTLEKISLIRHDTTRRLFRG